MQRGEREKEKTEGRERRWYNFRDYSTDILIRDTNIDVRITYILHRIYGVFVLQSDFTLGLSTKWNILYEKFKIQGRLKRDGEMGRFNDLTILKI